MAVKIKVTYYEDDREEIVVVSPRAQVETERHFSGMKETRAVETAMYLAWYSLNRAGKEPAAFEQWLDKIADVDQVDGEDKAPGPTDATPSLTASSA